MVTEPLGETVAISRDGLPRFDGLGVCNGSSWGAPMNTETTEDERHEDNYKRTAGMHWMLSRAGRCHSVATSWAA